MLEVVPNNQIANTSLNIGVKGKNFWAFTTLDMAFQFAMLQAPETREP